jgi:hypothetical protein
MPASPPTPDVSLRGSEPTLRAKSGCEQTQQRSPYSITSSARASSVAGTSRPSALPVGRLMTVSYLVVCLYRQVRLRVAVAAIPRVTEIIQGFLPNDQAGALETAERSFLAAALDYGCTENLP